MNLGLYVNLDYYPKSIHTSSLSNSVLKKIFHFRFHLLCQVCLMSVVLVYLNGEFQLSV